MAGEPNETSRNIPRINTDILYDIFYQLNDAHHVDWDEFKGEGLPLGWVRVTGVCREWRDVAISHADLWTCIDLNAHKLAMTMISRARDKPLRLYYRYPRYDPTDPSPSPSTQDKEIWALMMGPMLSRVEEIYVSNISAAGFFTFLLDDMKRRTATILKSFRIFHDSTAGLTMDDRVTCVPFHFFYWSMPMLRHLELQGFVHAVWWDPIRLPNLRHLDLSTCDGLTLEVYSPELVRTLGQMPHLRTMTLKNVQLDPWDIGPMPLAELSELESLSIHARHTKILHLLHYIRYPSTAEVSIKCFDIHDQTVEELLSAVLSNRAIMSSKPSRVVAAIGTAFHLKAFHDGDDDPLFEISLEHQRGINQSYFPLDTFSELLQILTPKEFACAITLGFQTATIQEWVDFFQPFGSDCQLALTCCCSTALPNIIRALSRLPASDHLRSVMLAPSALRVFYPGHDVSSESQGTPALVTCLYELFTSPDSSYHIAFEPKMSTIAKEIARTLKELLNDENLKSEDVQGFMSLVYGKDVGMLPERTLPGRLVALALSFLLWS